MRLHCWSIQLGVVSCPRGRFNTWSLSLISPSESSERWRYHARESWQKSHRAVPLLLGSGLYDEHISSSPTAHSTDGGQWFHSHRGQRSRRWRTRCAGVL